ncbi:hypothetical protein HAX54_037505 [Datura stramonium]|uniref:Uncharacterized protein n=1 Tax=Datura stramonium TaxID=4076 RepID=A0ABS8SGZ3_DATST|nr:hypothetical protein [Datura stramonium]
MLQSLQLADCTRLQWIPELPLRSIQARFWPGDIDDILDLSCLDNLEVRAVDVELCNYLTSTKSKGPLQGLYEFGIHNIFVPGGKIPTKFNNISTGSSIAFTVPQVPNVKIQGLEMCIAYAEYYEEMFQ